MSDFAETTIDPGDLVRKLRKLRGMTQEQLANELGYSTKQVARIERGRKEISKEAMNLLSRVFNIDLHQYIFLSQNFTSTSSYNEYIHLRRLVETRNFSKMKYVCSQLSSKIEQYSGEMLQLITYANALISSYIDNNYALSNKYCFDALAVFSFNDYSKSLKCSILTEMSYPPLFLLTYNYSMMGEYKLSNELSVELYNHFKNMIFDKSVPIKSDMYHMKKYYIGATNNLSNLYFTQENYLESMLLIDHALLLSEKFDINVHLYYLLELKFKNLYKLGDIEQARKFFRYFKNTCEISGNNDYYNNVFDEIHLNYTQLFHD